MFEKFQNRVARYCPEAFVFAVILTIVMMALVFALTDSTFPAAISAWGNGLHGLLAFIAQITLTIITAHVLANTNAVLSMLQSLGKVPGKTWQAYALVTISSGIFSLISWPLGLIAGGLIARQVSLQAQQRGIAVHYPLLVAGAFGGFIVWHMGYSSTIGLSLATAGNPLEEKIGALIPITETLLSWWNLLTICTTLTVVTVTIILLHPQGQIVSADESNNPTGATRPVEANRAGFMGQLEDSRIVPMLLALMLFTFLLHWFYTRGADLTLNIVNWSFLGFGLLFANSARHYSDLFADGARVGSATLLQYPLYGGIMGLMLSTGLAEQFSDLIIAVSSAETLPYWAFASAGLVNIFIPSGGAQWAVQGPIFVEAAQTLGTDVRVIAMSIAWGDQWTNIIQPFCAIPLLAVTGLKLRQIYGYCFVLLAVSSLTFVLGLYLAS